MLHRLVGVTVSVFYVILGDWFRVFFRLMEYVQFFAWMILSNLCSF